MSHDPIGEHLLTLVHDLRQVLEVHLPRQLAQLHEQFRLEHIQQDHHDVTIADATLQKAQNESRASQRVQRRQLSFLKLYGDVLRDEVKDDVEVIKETLRIDLPLSVNGFEALINLVREICPALLQVSSHLLDSTSIVLLEVDFLIVIWRLEDALDAKQLPGRLADDLNRLVLVLRAF